MSDQNALPGWFSLSRYAHVSEFSVRDWFTHLLILRIGFSELAAGMSREYYDATFKRRFSPGTVLKPSDSQKLDESERKKYLQTLVLDLDIISVLDFSDRIRMNKKYLDDWEKWKLDETVGASLRDSFNDFEPHISSEYAYAEVNLGAPEQLAAEAFMHWFRKMKSKRALASTKTTKGGAIGPQDLLKLANYQVLAYLELKLWLDIHGKKIPHWRYAEALFPDRDGDTTEMVRKTTIKLAKLAIDFRTIHALQIQSRIETGPI